MSGQRAYRRWTSHTYAIGVAKLIIVLEAVLPRPPLRVARGTCGPLDGRNGVLSAEEGKQEDAINLDSAAKKGIADPACAEGGTGGAVRIRHYPPPSEGTWCL